MTRILRFVAWVGASAALVWIVTVALVLYSGASPQLRKADAILVLGAAQYNGRPSPVLRARLDHALELHRRGLAPRFVLTGGVGRGDTLSEGEVAQRYVLAAGVDAPSVLVERRGLSSAESVAAAATLLRAHGLQRVLVVSDSYHMLRLELLARRYGLQPLRAPTPDVAPRSRERWALVLRESWLFPATAVAGGR